MLHFIMDHRVSRPQTALRAGGHGPVMTRLRIGLILRDALLMDAQDED
jgi:hypothetical protein